MTGFRQWLVKLMVLQQIKEGFRVNGPFASLRPIPNQEDFCAKGL